MADTAQRKRRRSLAELRRDIDAGRTHAMNHQPQRENAVDKPEVYEMAQILLRAIRAQRSDIETGHMGGKFDVLATWSDPARCEAKVIGELDVLALARAVAAAQSH
jgi:hypothetical protein